MPNEWPKNEVLESEREKENIVQALEIIKKTEIFDEEFLKNLRLVIFSDDNDKAISTYFSGEMHITSPDDYSIQDFMQGRRIDFAEINPKKEFEEFMEIVLKEKRHLEIIFFDDKLAYEEFVAHEVAHNLFDREYLKRNSRYEEREGITDVTDDYREKIKGLIIPLLKKHYPGLEAEKFLFNRQQIAEIFAMIYEREFCRRSNINMELHRSVERRIAQFFENPEKMLAEFNGTNEDSHEIEELYVEKHALSIIITPLLEKEYPNWEERTNIFWK